MLKTSDISEIAPASFPCQNPITNISATGLSRPDPSIDAGDCL